MTTAGAHRGQQAEASHKRKREVLEAEKVVERKYGLDMDILECPICSEPFSPPVYQCRNGHTACSSCCEKLVTKRCPTCTVPTGTIRCIAIEKILESLLVSCKYAEYGCKEMHNRSDIEEHETNHCDNEPFPCPVEDCIYELGSNVSLIAHLAEEHQVGTVYGPVRGAIGFKMESSDRFVIVDVKGDEEGDLFFLVHRQVNATLGDVFFCSSFQGSYESNYYSLEVVLSSEKSVSHSIAGALAIDLRWRKFTDYRNQHFLLLPFLQPLVADADRPVKVHLRIYRKEAEDDDSEDDD